MDIRHLRIFLDVIETGRMSGAARKNYISQPTVSQVVRELEEYYGVRLFERLAKKLFLTPAGQELATRARIVVSQFDAMDKSMREEQGRQQLRLGATRTVGYAILPGLVNDLRARGIDVFAYMDNTSVMERKLLLSELDAALVEGTVKSQELIVRPVMADRLVMACGRRHPFYGRETVHAQELKGMEFAMREQGSGTRELFEAFLERRGIGVKACCEAGGSDLVKRAVVENGYLAVISERLIEEGDDLCLWEHGEWGRYFSLIYHKDKYVDQNMEALLQWAESWQEQAPERRSRGRLLG